MAFWGWGQAVAVSHPVSNLQAEVRDGQVFLTWSEAETPEGTTFNVYVQDRPFDGESWNRTRRVGFRLPRHSARNWWLDPAAFHSPRRMPEGPAPEAEGFRIRPGGEPLEPTGGLFVHTAVVDGPAEAYFAVTSTDAGGKENRTLVPGGNTTGSAARPQVSLPQPIAWRPGASVPARGAHQGLPVVIALHGRGGSARQQTREGARFMVFGDASQGWTEGIPWVFDARFGPDAVTFRPLDAIWAGRPVTESPDGRDHCPAISTWWFGCNEFIHERDRMAEGRVVNYAQHRLLYLARWAVEHLGCDPDRVYIQGGSMGGSGAVAMALHHPDVFAAAYADVPVVSHTHRTCPGGGASSAWRLLGLAGPDLDARTVADGTPLLTHMNGVHHLGQAQKDFPPLYVVNGRTDRSIPWCNNPEFYRALNDTRRGFVAAWNNGAHGEAQRLVPAELQDAQAFLFRFRRNESYPAFSNVSTNDDPGNGNREDGDIAGLMNYGVDWADVVDRADRYAVSITADERGRGYPVTLDLTPRRLQRFQPAPGARVQADAGGVPVDAVVREDGTFTFEGIRIDGPAGVRIEVREVGR